MSHQIGTRHAKNHNFITHIPIFFKKSIIILIHFVVSPYWVPIHKGNSLGHQLQACDVINKPNLDVYILYFNLGYKVYNIEIS